MALGEARGVRERACEGALRASGPVTSMLTGGLDSTNVTVAAARLLAPQGLIAATRVPDRSTPAETAGRFFDETPFAQATAARHPNIDWHRVADDDGDWGERNPQRIGTGVVIGDHVYTANVGPGTMECIDVATGEVQWQTRTPSGDTWASIVSAAGRLYVTSQRGTTHVVQPNPETLVIVASNALGETVRASPAVSDGELVLRTHKNLFCIGR